MRLLPALTLIISMPALAQDTAFLYEIGGARPITGAATANFTASLAISSSLVSGNTCDRFDPLASVSATLNDVRQGIDNFSQQAVLAAQSAIAGLPMLILQRINPGLYDIFQNALLAAKADVNLSVGTCEELQQTVLAGENPFKDWVQYGASVTWEDKSLTLGNNVRKAETEVKRDGGKAGVPWLCGQRQGGQNQRQIQPVRDAVMLGFNTILQRSPCSTAAAPMNSTISPGAIGSSLGDLFPNPTDAQGFVAQVVGDTQISTYNQGPGAEQPGVGIMPAIERDSIFINATMGSLTIGTQNPTPAQRRNMSAPGMPITNQLLDALRDMPSSDRSALISRLSDEVSMARNIQKLLFARRMLLAATDNALLQQNGIEEVESAIADIESEIEQLTYEYDIRQKLVSNTALLILGRQREKRSEPFIQAPGRQDPPLQDGVAPR